MPNPDDEPSTESASAVSPARFAEVEATVADLAALLRDTLSRDPQRPSGTDYEPHAPVHDAAAKSSYSPTDAPPAQEGACQQTAGTSRLRNNCAVQLPQITGEEARREAC
eukprot:jgi/Tetstr1/454474/TSEL_041374.t1